MKEAFFPNLRKFILYFATGCFIILSAMVLFGGTFYWDSTVSIYNEMSPWKRGILFILLITCVIIFFTFLKHLYQRFFKQIDYRILVGFVWGLLILLQIVFLLCSRNLLRYDALNVYDEAVSIFYDGEISGLTKGGYFSYYSNNYPIAVITFAFLKIGRLLHIVDRDFGNGLLFLQFINLAAVDIAYLFGYLFIKDHFKSRSLGFSYLLFLLLSPLTYVWLPFYYTNTLSMPFYMGGLWLVCRCLFGAYQKWNPKKKAFCFLISGFFFYIGSAIRATVVITIIALVISLFFYKMNKKDWIQLVAFILGMVIGFGSLTPLIHKYVKFDYSDSAFPVIHWIMMGAGGEGTYSKKDEEFTAQFETAQEKQDADKALFNQRLTEMGVMGTIRHAFGKVFLTFGDGAGCYTKELSISEHYGTLYRFVYGDRSQNIYLISQIMYLAALLGGIISAVYMLRKKEFHPIFIVLINILGAFFFYMLWEAGTVYSIGFLPLFYIALAGGIHACASYTPIKVPHLKPAAAGLFIIIMMAESMIWLHSTGEQEELTYQVNQFMFQTDHYQACSDGIVLQQTFQSTGLFDHVAIQARNPLGRENDSIYSIELRDDEDRLCDSFIVNSADIIDFAFVRLNLTQPLGEGGYKLILQKVSGTDDLIWLYYDTGNYDAYTGGELTGFPIYGKLDMTFKIYYGEEPSDYFDWYKEYLSEHGYS